MDQQLQAVEGREAPYESIEGRIVLNDRNSLLLPLALSRAIAQRYPGCELTVAYIDSYGDSVGASWIAD